MRKITSLSIISLTLVATLVFSARLNIPVDAASYSELQGQAQSLSAQIKANNAKLAELADAEASLTNFCCSF